MALERRLIDPARVDEEEPLVAGLGSRRDEHLADHRATAAASPAARESAKMASSTLGIIAALLC
jgi:hypothetical protein